MSKSIKLGSKWSGKTAASALGAVGISNNSDDIILLTNTTGPYKVKEILSREDFEGLVADETGKKIKGKNPTNRNIARAFQNEFNKQSKSQSRETKKASVARSPLPAAAAAKSLSISTTRRRPKVAPVIPTPVIPTPGKNNLERNLRLIAEAEAKEAKSLASRSPSPHNNSKELAKLTVPKLKEILKKNHGETDEDMKKMLKKDLIELIITYRTS